MVGLQSLGKPDQVSGPASASLLSHLYNKKEGYGLDYTDDL